MKNIICVNLLKIGWSRGKNGLKRQLSHFDLTTHFHSSFLLNWGRKQFGRST